MGSSWPRAFPATASRCPRWSATYSRGSPSGANRSPLCGVIFVSTAHPWPAPERPGVQLGIICTGDGVLTGTTINTNFSYMSQKLSALGLAVRSETTVGDDPDTLPHAFQ